MLIGSSCSDHLCPNNLIAKVSRRVIIVGATKIKMICLWLFIINAIMERSSGIRMTLQMKLDKLTLNPISRISGEVDIYLD